MEIELEVTELSRKEVSHVDGWRKPNIKGLPLGGPSLNLNPLPLRVV